MRVHVKKKRYRMHCREQTLSGKGSAPSGNWVNADTAKSVDKNVYCGTLGAEPGVGRPKKGGRVRTAPNTLGFPAYPRWWPNNWEKR